MVSRFVNDHSPPSSAVLAALTERWNVSASWVLTGIPPMLLTEAPSLVSVTPAPATVAKDPGPPLAAGFQHGVLTERDAQDLADGLRSLTPGQKAALTGLPANIGMLLGLAHRYFGRAAALELHVGLDEVVMAAYNQGRRVEIEGRIDRYLKDMQIELARAGPGFASHSVDDAEDEHRDEKRGSVA